MAEISVIVAVYKMEQYLPRCLESILGQSFRDIELILVDDGSPDHCGEICDAYALKDSRVHVIHKLNGGVCAARNTGLDWVFDNSESSWIFFHDNDDWMHPQTLERMRAAAIEMNTAITICGYQETTGEDPIIDPALLNPVLWKPKDFYMHHFVNATVCWGKLYQRSCFEGMRYPPGKCMEDEFLTYRILFAQETLSVILAPLYAYFVNSQGITKSNWTPKKLDAWEAYDQQIAFFEKMGDDELVRFRFRGYLENALANLQLAQMTENPDTNIIEIIRKKVRCLIRKMWKSGYIDFWSDFDILYEFYPLLTRFYRLWLEIRQKWRKYSG